MNTRFFISVVAVAAVLCLINSETQAEVVGGARSGVLSQPGLTLNPSQRSFNQGNLIVTGNVGGGKHFRGIVPYRSTSEFGVSVPSASLNSFYRRSTGSEFGRSSQTRLTPYYLPSQTVTSLKRGRGSGLQPPRFRFDIRTGASVLEPTGKAEVDQTAQDKIRIEKEYSLAELMKRYPYIRSRPLDAEIEELEAFEVARHRKRLTRGDLSQALRRGQDGVFRRDMQRLTQTQRRKDARISDANKPFEPHDKIAKPPEPPEPYTMRSWLKENEQRQTVSIFERMKQLLDEEPKPADKSEAESEKEIDDTAKLDLRKAELDKMVLERAIERHRAQAKAQREKLHTMASKSFVINAESRFNEYMSSAEGLMKEGKYYRAADAYTLAGMYGAKDPLPYAGKAHALLAAGEYMSSAYFLSRVLEMFPGYTRFKIDLVSMIGDKEVLDKRIGDLAEKQEKSNSGELQLLLAYVYYQTDQLADAKRMINKSAEKLDDSFAVSVLKKAIEQRQ